MSEYRCTALAISDRGICTVGTFPFRFEGHDPKPKFIFPLVPHLMKATGTGSIDALGTPRVRDRVAHDVARAARGWLGSRGAEADHHEVAEVIRAGLTHLYYTDTGGYVFGATRWGDILLRRDIAQDWAKAARLVTTPLTWAQLCYRLPSRAREPVVEACKSFETGAEPLSAHRTEDWWLALEEQWPWLAEASRQEWPPELPDDAPVESFTTTLDGDYLSWVDADSTIEELAARGVPCVRDDGLVDGAMGPHGIRGWHRWDVAEEGCGCGRPLPDSCERHPGPTLVGEDCPSCGTNQMVPIVNGHPVREDAWPKDRIVGGGETQPDDPTQGCRACGLLLGPEGTWRRRTLYDEPTPVLRLRLPPTEDGLAEIFAAAATALDETLAADPDHLDRLVPAGQVARPWWAEIPGLARGCSCLGPPGSPPPVLASYVLTSGETWKRELEPAWESHTVGMLHVRNVHEPIGSILVRRRGGDVVAIEGPDAGGVLEEAKERFQMTPVRTLPSAWS